MNNTQRRVWFLAAIGIAVCITVLMLSHIVTEPWHTIPNIGGDGGKNIFTYLYHSIYGKGYWFQGMNYPYGEHIVYTDGQPLLSVFFASIGNVPINTALAVSWWLLGLSYVLGNAYSYKILTWYKVRPLPAVLYACLMGIMAPQVICLSGHYALGYACVIPMVFYWTIRYNASSRISYCVYLFLLGITAAFLHMYYAGMLLVWVGSYTIGYFIFSKQAFGIRLRHALPILASAACVAAIVMVTLKLTDPIKDRPVTPLSLPETYAHIKQIASSRYSPLWAWTDRLADNHKASKGGEGFSYPGIVTLGVVSLFGLYLIANKLRKRQHSAVVHTGLSPVFVFMALAVLAFSMGIPFIWHMQWLMNYFSFFKQFRALGRFAWIFYYIICVYGILIITSLYNSLAAQGRKIAAEALLATTMIVWATEASGYILWSRETAKQAVYYHDFIFSGEEQNWISFLEEHHLKKEDFQAILTLKLFHVGSEKLWVGNGDWTITLSGKAALQLHLPVVDVMMSRTSWEQTRKQVRIAAGPYSDKPLLRETNNEKPFLLMRFEEDSLDADQKYLLGAADYIGHHSQCDVYALYPAKLRALNKQHHDEIAPILPGFTTGDTCVRGSGQWYTAHFDDKAHGDHLFGAGGMQVIRADDSTVAEIPVNITRDNQLYEMSAWFQLGNTDFRSPDIDVVMQYANGSRPDTVHMHAKWSVDNYKDWYRANAYFHVKHSCNAIKCIVYNTPNPSYLYMDELMLRPADALIISKSADGAVMVNNHLFNAVYR